MLNIWIWVKRINRKGIVRIVLTTESNVYGTQQMSGTVLRILH